ncbi:uncharacterized protein CTRU02_207534 [Colletotrichum truncatum]|uniref:Uncharacterized protein n=1 Tax=Colletotrichum truncatum TaxID=5467 RepID=A0ACC3Z139_COLTU|nr:uncharacterized protein CTRU02_00837 [Colletotrichum truncatum]KAF6800432.1 hypothetical protein CTRU02_00837 [Colletotrichum truncatum]
MRPAENQQLVFFPYQYGVGILGRQHRGIHPLDCRSATTVQLMQVGGHTCQTRLAGNFAFSRETWPSAQPKASPRCLAFGTPAAAPPEWGLINKPWMEADRRLPHFP